MEDINNERLTDIGEDSTKKIRAAAKALTHQEARYLVQRYYQVQEMRKITNNQLMHCESPTDLLTSINGNLEKVEQRIKLALGYYTDAQKLSAWAKSILGIGDVISAGLYAHIKFTRWRCANIKKKKKKIPCKEAEPCTADCRFVELTSAAQIWRHAGLDPTSVWNKGELRPWNADLKKLCYLIGESFIKVSNNDSSLYGQKFKQRKEIEARYNVEGKLAAEAQRQLDKKKYSKETEAYKWYAGCLKPEVWTQYYEAPPSSRLGLVKRLAGEPMSGVQMLPPAHIHARARRWVVKLFLSHYFEEGCRVLLGKEPPTIYSIAILNHIDYIGPEVSFDAVAYR